MAWFTSRWRWATFNVAALIILIFVLTQGSEEWHQAGDGFDPMLESGKWGIRCLLICLLMTPLHTYLHWRSALKLRKAAGLWAFAFGVTHFLLYARETWEPVAAFRAGGLPWYWLVWPWQLYIALGLLALTILTLLAITSNHWAMRRLGKQWKQLHRLVYGAGVAIVCHALLAATMSKKMMVRDPHVVPELQLYLGVLTVLLVIRIPHVRVFLLKLMAGARPQLQPIQPIHPIVLPSRTPSLPQWPTLSAPTAVPGADHRLEPIKAGDKLLNDEVANTEEITQRAMRELVH
jgi:methionine sulfoxide reductase heme-binding subunit